MKKQRIEYSLIVVMVLCGIALFVSNIVSSELGCFISGIGVVLSFTFYLKVSGK